MDGHVNLRASYATSDVNISTDPLDHTACEFVRVYRALSGIANATLIIRLSFGIVSVGELTSVCIPFNA